MLRVLNHLSWDQNCSGIYCDNSSIIKQSRNPVMYERSKHIAIRYHLLRDLSKDGVVELKYCKSQDQVVDIMTKPLKLGLCKAEGTFGSMCNTIKLINNKVI